MILIIALIVSTTATPVWDCGLLLQMHVSFAYRNPCANVSGTFFDIFNSRNIMKSTTVVVWLGLCKCVAISNSFIFWFEYLLQPFTNKWVYSLEHVLSLVSSILRNPVQFCVPVQQRLVISIATAACGACALAQKQSIYLKKITHAHTLICNMKFYFTVFMKENHAFK